MNPFIHKESHVCVQKKKKKSQLGYKFHCGLCNEYYYVKCVRRLNVEIGQHTKKGEV